MQNSLKLSAKDENSLEKTVTTKELAEVLGVEKRTIQETANRLLSAKVLSHLETKSVVGGKTFVFDEEQATLIKQEIQKKSESVQKWYTIEELAELCGIEVGTLTKGNSPLTKLNIDFEVETHFGGYHNTKKFYSENVLKALKQYQLRNSVPNAIKDKATVLEGNISFVQQETVKQTITSLMDNPQTLQLLLTESLSRQQSLQIENKQLKDVVAEQKPKALVYDKICNADGLKSVEQVASNLGWGKNNFFALMRGMGIFFYSSKDADGRKVNLPKREYVERGYFVTKEEPYTRGDKDRLYTKIYVTGKGETWLANKLNEAVEDSAGKLIENIAK